jgi:predicted RNA-binding Zn-ribbon protein involved in translation (DUF1610 family)
MEAGSGWWERIMAQRKTINVLDNQTAEFVCPSCKETRIIRLEEEIRSSTPVRMRYLCDCGTRHVLFLEKRTSVRKKVAIEGSLKVDGDSLPITIKNLSRNGLMFTPSNCRIEVEIGDRMSVDFALEQVQRVSFSKKIEVRWKTNLEIGAEFVAERGRSPYDPAYDLALAQYQAPE